MYLKFHQVQSFEYKIKNPFSLLVKRTLFMIFLDLLPENGFHTGDSQTTLLSCETNSKDDLVLFFNEFK